jgi:hypothetical protein
MSGWAILSERLRVRLVPPFFHPLQDNRIAYTEFSSDLSWLLANEIEREGGFFFLREFYLAADFQTGMIMTTLANHVGHIVFLRSRKKMIGIHTISVVARMERKQTLRQRSPSQF